MIGVIIVMNESEMTLDQSPTPGPVAARSPHGLVRYMQERKSLIRDRVLTVAATLLVLLIGLAAWWYYSQQQVGRIILTNQGTPLLAQVLPESGDEPLDEPFDVVARSTLALPAGDYRLRVNAPGRLGRTYRFAVNRGETIAHELSLDDGRLLGGDIQPPPSGGEKPQEEPMPFATVTKTLELTPGRFDIVELNGHSVIRRDGTTGKPVWDTASPNAHFGPGRDPGPLLGRLGPTWLASHVVQPAIDLDSDGTRDVLAVVGNNYAFIALSGQDGSLLWNYAAVLDGPGGPLSDGPSAPGPAKPAERPGSLIGPPAIGDVDGDGTPDLIATRVDHELPAEVQKRTGKPPAPMTTTFSRRVVLAISGRSGRWVWAFPMDRAFTSIKSRYWERPAVLLRSRRAAILVILDGSQVIVVDPATGRPQPNPIDLGFEPVRPLQYADFDGDGEPEVLALGPGSSPNQQSLSVHSIGTGKVQWTATIAAKYPLPHEPHLPSEWPWLIDLDADDKSEVVLPDSGPMPPSPGYRGVRVRDGSTGQNRWVRRMRPETKAEDGLNRILAAPDLDGDGVRDLVALSRFVGRKPPTSRTDWRPEPERAYVDALSGRDGHPFWSWHSDLEESKSNWIGVPLWWGRGPDGWPLLAVPLGGRDLHYPRGFVQAGYLDSAAVHVLEASTGREQNLVTRFSSGGAADFDGDGLDDLWGEADGQLRAYRGEPPEAWRALGHFAPARKSGFPSGGNIERGAADFDGDGISDTLGGGLNFSGTSAQDATGSRTIIARSGRDGRLLWKAALDPAWLWFLPEPARSYSFEVFPLPSGDLNGDGTPDVIVPKYSYDESTIGRQPASLPYQLLSGRDGRHLWSARPLPLGFEAFGFSTVVWSECRAIEPNAPPDIVVLHRSPFVKAIGPPAPALAQGPTRQRLARVSGRTGRMVWDIPLEDQPSNAQPGDPFPPKLGDFDGDGSLDAALIVRVPAQPGQPEFELKAISLHDGASRWSRLLRYDGMFSDVPSVEIGTGVSNGPGAIFVTESPTTPTSNELLVHAFDGRDGTDRWTWRSGVGEGDRKVEGGIDAIALDRPQKDSICVTYSDMKRECRVVVLDPQGHERARRVVPPEPVPTQVFPPVIDFMIDLDGDGRDELIVWNDNRLNAWGSDLKDRWSIPAKSWQVLRVQRASPGGPSTLILPPATAVDGVSGKVRWTFKPPALWYWYGGDPLDPGDSSRLPRMIISRNMVPVTVCQDALPATPGGDYLPPSGSRPPSGASRGDPRWTRPRPWMNLMAPETARAGVLALFGLALLNLFVPLGILWLAARRRPWSLRALMALPVAAAVPLSAFLTLEPLMPIPAPTSPLPSSPLALFALGTAAGVPVVFFAVVAGWTLVRRRWRNLGLIVGFTALSSLAIAAICLRLDMRAMPAIEHYNRSGWYFALLAGASVAGALMLIGWPIRAVIRGIRRRRPPRTASDA